MIQSLSLCLSWRYVSVVFHETFLLHFQVYFVGILPQMLAQVERASSATLGTTQSTNMLLKPQMKRKMMVDATQTANNAKAKTRGTTYDSNDRPPEVKTTHSHSCKTWDGFMCCGSNMLANLSVAHKHFFFPNQCPWIHMDVGICGLAAKSRC